MRPQRDSAPLLFKYFREYEEFHRHPVNLLSHKIAIPLIVFHTVVMLDWLKLGSFAGVEWTAAMLALVAFYFFYWKLHPPYATLMLIFGAFCVRLGHVTPGWLVFGLAGTAWTVQLAGHLFYEQRQPAFLSNVLQTFISPLYVIALFDGTITPRPWRPPAAE